jgi:hypothetical protein
MSMTPFELRFNLLNFAQNNLVAEYHCKLEERRIQGSFGKAVEITPYPTKEEVFALAEEYRAFVERK